MVDDSPRAPSGACPQAALDVSVVCPFFNEAALLERSVRRLVERLRTLERTWELVLVNDGSTDGSADIASALVGTTPGLVLVSYHDNRGRGHALRQGIARARGDVVVTTEIDLSWGVDVVERLCRAMAEHPEADIVVASPNVAGGGYRNVPPRRVLLSRLGNLVIRAGMGSGVTMNTGMTRAYRRLAIQSLPCDEDGKEFHLEVIFKARALKLRIMEIPAVLEWNARGTDGAADRRRRPGRLGHLVATHLLFVLFANPIRYLWGVAAANLLCSLGFLAWAVVRLVAGLVSVYELLVSLAFATIAMIFVSFGVIVRQNSMVQKEIWTLQRDLFLRDARRGDGK
jgi:glycosyltransferase involved in cell wall biosynthesis